MTAAALWIAPYRYTGQRAPIPSEADASSACIVNRHAKVTHHVHLKVTHPKLNLPAILMLFAEYINGVKQIWNIPAN
ncbi:MAG: hypothetical protein LBB66_10260 [Desulfovibrio sp.]|jgi:hypothetical protein|nr:hypothetical protein [Desulfovibrio sp.]